MAMTDEARQARNEYFKQWRKNNRDKVRDAQARYWQRKAQNKEPANDAGNGGGGNEQEG